MNIQEAFTKRQIPVSSAFMAIRYCNLREFSMKEQIGMLSELIPSDYTDNLDPIPLKYSFLYFVQDTVNELSQGKTEVNCSDIFIGACLKADSYLAKNPWIYTKEFIMEEEIASKPLPKTQRGTKVNKVIALYKKVDADTMQIKDFAKLVEKEIGMTPAGALTYAYLARKKLTTK